MSETATQTKNANLCRHLAHAANTIPTELAVSVQKQQLGKLCYSEINFANLHQRSDEIALALTGYGLKPGMKAVLMVTPSIDFFSLTFALFKAGIVPILVDPGMGIKNLKQCFAESQPDAFIGIPKAHIARILFSWGKGSVKKLLTVGGSDLLAKLIGGISLHSLLKRYGVKKAQTFNIVKLGDDDMSAILFTSGSTGTPKGVVYSHKMFEAQITALKEDYAITAGERDLATFPLFSLFGPALGMASIVPDMDASKPIKANPNYIFAAIEKYQCTNLFANPALIEILGQAGTNTSTGGLTKLKSLKRVISAGAPATLPSIKRFTELLNEETPVLTSYGATESLPLTKIASQDLLTTSDITDNGGGICVGKPVKGVDISIIEITEQPIDVWHNSLVLPTNSIGEIVVKGDMVSQQYYRRQSATLQAKIQDTCEQEGSVSGGSVQGDSAQGDSTQNINSVRHRMGDLGYIDEQGLLWMCGRKAHRVETETNVFFSIPCERIFNTHSDVKRTALVGVTMMNKTVPLLCIELTDDAKNIKTFDESALLAQLKVIALSNKQTSAIAHFLMHENFPVDIRHNAKIFREQLAAWAQEALDYE